MATWKQLCGTILEWFRPMARLKQPWGTVLEWFRPMARWKQPWGTVLEWFRPMARWKQLCGTVLGWFRPMARWKQLCGTVLEWFRPMARWLQLCGIVLEWLRPIARWLQLCGTVLEWFRPMARWLQLCGTVLEWFRPMARWKIFDLPRSEVLQQRVRVKTPSTAQFRYQATLRSCNRFDISYMNLFKNSFRSNKTKSLLYFPKPVISWALQKYQNYDRKYKYIKNHIRLYTNNRNSCLQKKFKNMCFDP